MLHQKHLSSSVKYKKYIYFEVGSLSNGYLKVEALFLCFPFYLLKIFPIGYMENI